MSVGKFCSRSIDKIRRNGVQGLADVSYESYVAALSRLNRLDAGDFTVYEQDWDVLVVLDACRPDLFAEVAPEYEFTSEFQSIRSAGSNSEQWLEETFSPRFAEEMAQTTYIVGNPFSDTHLDPTDFAVLDELWRHAWDEDIGTVPPEPLTETAIYRWRNGDHDRMIVHYMQPHFPSIPKPDHQSGIDLNDVGDGWSSVWEMLRRGEADTEEVWNAYRANLEHVLDSVGELVTSIDADQVVVTSDHGNAFGSWGLYGHPPAPIDAVRQVPWCETTARNVSDRNVDTPSWVSEGADRLDSGTEKKLKDLGYI